MQLTTRQQYDKVVSTFVLWLNWKGRSDVGGLLLGLADYYAEIRELEDALDLPLAERFNLRSAYEWSETA